MNVFLTIHFFVAVMAVLPWCQPQAIFSFEGAYGALADTASTTYDWFAKRTGMADVCPFVDSITVSLNESLPINIRGQRGGVDIILNAVAAWEFQRRVGLSEPLVLAIAGSTGVGKSETAYRMAEAIFMKKTRVGNTRRFIPNGLLILRGEDYSSDSEAAALGIGEVHKRIKSRIMEHLRTCAGNAVIVFDEVQKVIPGALDVLMPGLRERGSFTSTTITTTRSTLTSLTSTLTSSTPPSKSSEMTHEEINTGNTIFIFISDIGADRMTNLLLTYGDRDHIPQNILRSEVKTALDEQWSRLHFGTAIKEVIPYLPMEKTQIEEVLRLKMSSMAIEYRHFYWMDLVIDDAVIKHLSGSRYIKYYNHTVKFRVNQLSESSKDDKDDSHGNINSATGYTKGNAEESSVDASVDTSMNVDENLSSSSADKPSSDKYIEKDASKIHNKGNKQMKTITRSKSFASWGARALENAGPIQDLRSLMQRYMPPWQPQKVHTKGCISMV